MKYLRSAMLRGAISLLSGSQRLVVAGASQGVLQDTVWYSTQSSKSLPALDLFGNAEEANTRVWLHASKSDARKLLIFSPDTDTRYRHLLHQHDSISSQSYQQRSDASDKHFRKSTTTTEAPWPSRSCNPRLRNLRHPS